MAQLKASIRTFTNGRPIQQGRLGEDQADATLTAQAGTIVRASLFHDGSGIFKIERAGKVYRLRWTENNINDPDSIEIYADFDGVEAALALPETTDARD